MDARPTNLVTLTKKVYGIEKRSKKCRINKWDCRPISKRTADPERKANLRNRLSRIHKLKTEAATCAVSAAVSDNERKKANETRLVLPRVHNIYTEEIILLHTTVFKRAANNISGI